VPGQTVGISNDVYPFLDRWLRSAPERWAAYDPLCPEPSHRNVVMGTADLERMTSMATTPVVRDVYPRFGLADDDMLRVVICEGPSLLGYVSLFQASPFEPHQRRLLAHTVPALRRRLSTERLMTMAVSTRRLLDAAITEISAATFILSQHGSVIEANAVGKLWLERGGLEARRRLRDAVRPLRRLPTGAFRVTPVEAPGVATRYLVIENAASGNFDGVRSVGFRWGLTAREIDVLVALAEGLSTRMIAAHLRVSERTVETHLTSMFEKAQTESRAELVAKAMRAM